jgi:hypothetical protein
VAARTCRFLRGLPLCLDQRRRTRGHGKILAFSRAQNKGRKIEQLPKG